MEEKSPEEKLNELIPRVKALENDFQVVRKLKERGDFDRPVLPEEQHPATLRTDLDELVERVSRGEKQTLDLSERLTPLDIIMKEQETLKASVTELSDIVSRPKVPAGTTTGIEGGIKLPGSPAPPEAPPEEPPEKEEPPEEPPEESSRLEVIHRIADFLKS